MPMGYHHGTRAPIRPSRVTDRAFERIYRKMLITSNMPANRKRAMLAYWCSRARKDPRQMLQGYLYRVGIPYVNV